MTPPKPPTDKPGATSGLWDRQYLQYGIPEAHMQRVQRRLAREAAGETVQPYKRKTLAPGDVIRYRKRSLMKPETSMWGSRRLSDVTVHAWQVRRVDHNWIQCSAVTSEDGRLVYRVFPRETTDHLMETIYQPPRSRRA